MLSEKQSLLSLNNVLYNPSMGQHSIIIAKIFLDIHLRIVTEYRFLFSVSNIVIILVVFTFSKHVKVKIIHYSEIVKK